MRHSVLIIDDDKLSMKYYRTALETEGFEVAQVCDPDGAIKYLSSEQNRRPDVIVLDIMLPTGDRYFGKPESWEGLRTGILLYPEIKTQCPKVPIVVLTNVANPDIVAALPPGVRVYNKTDIAPFDLAAALNRHIQEGEAEQFSR
jgi:CheY-like chemotaxis protein